MDGTFIRLKLEFTDKTIPKLYRDKVISSGTKYCLDSKDTYSFAKQSAPVAGVDVWKNLLDGGPSASFTGNVGFDGGFKFVNAAGEFITLPASGIVPAAADAFVAIFWVKVGVPTGGAAVFNAGSGYTNTTNQYALAWASGALNFYVGGWQSPAIAAVDVVATSIKQFAVSAKKRTSDGKYDLVTYVDGVVKGMSVSSFDTYPQPSASYPAPLIGRGPSFDSAGWDGVVYRTVYDDCSAKTAADLVALDYTENRLRIAGA